MQTADFDYCYPENLVATRPAENFRILLAEVNAPVGDSVQSSVREITKDELLAQFQSGDTLVINNSQVVKRRVFSRAGLEILFLQPLAPTQWEVLFPAREVKDHDKIHLPGEVSMQLVNRGLPQTVLVDRELTDEYFQTHGELALPPYIQRARNHRHNWPEDEKWYQTPWAKVPGSQAAPTASLHFSMADLQILEERGVKIAPLTLHVGMGTFLPIKSQTLEDHKMHGEWIEIPAASKEKIIQTKANHKKVWALGTTAVRSIESWAHGLLNEGSDGSLSGVSYLFIRPGFHFEVVDCMLTNFHQPRSTLLALVASFAGRENVLAAYAWAIENQFRLFSYGDLSVWMR